MRLAYMENISLTGAQKSKLRGLGQKLEATIKVGKEGLTPAFFTELSRALRAHDLIKLRFVGDADRPARAALTAHDDDRRGRPHGAVLQTSEQPRRFFAVGRLIPTAGSRCAASYDPSRRAFV